MTWVFLLVLLNFHACAEPFSPLAELPKVQDRFEDIKRMDPNINNEAVLVQIIKEQNIKISNQKDKKYACQTELSDYRLNQEKTMEEIKDEKRKLEAEKVKMVESHKVELNKEKDEKDHCKVELEKAHKALDELRKKNENYSVMLKEMGII